MWSLTPPPSGSTIVVSRERDHTLLSWPTSTGGIARYAVGLFVLFWLGGWAWGLIDASRVLVDPASKAPKLFLAFWLGGWMIGGLMTILMLVRVLQPSKPERLRIYDNRLLHDPGSAPFNPFTRRYMTDQRQFWSDLFKRHPKTEIARQEAGDARLDRVGERLRLAIDHGALRTEIGQPLREPEKEWLAGILREWRRA